MSPSPILALSTAAVEGAVAVPFRLRFRPFIGGRDSREMPLFRAFWRVSLAGADKNGENGRNGFVPAPEVRQRKCGQRCQVID